jgi:WD40 repeat protein
MGMAVAVASPASAADTTTHLEGVTGVGDVAAGNGKVFVAALDKVVVADSNGAVTASINNLSGAVGLAIAADGSRLYVALSNSREVAEVDTTTLAITRRIGLTAYACPTNLALDGSRLWVGYGCYGSWSGGILSLDLATSTPTVVAAGMYGPPLVAAAGGVLAAAEIGVSPGSIQVYDVSGPTATQRGTISNNVSSLRDIGITPDGRTIISAGSSPTNHAGWDTTTLAQIRTYGQSGWWWPNAVAISPDGAFVAAGREYGPPVSIHDTATATTLHQGDNQAGDLVAGALTFSGTDVFGVLRDSSTGRFSLWRMQGATLAAFALALSVPQSATALQPLTLTGRLTFADGSTPGAQQLTVTRRLPDGTTASLPAVTTATDGTFTVTDTPPVAGDVTYQVIWDGDPAHRWSAASGTVTVAKSQSTLSVSGPATGQAGQEVRLTGSLRFGGQAPPAPVTLTVARTFSNNFGSGEDQLAPVTTGADGSFSIVDVPAQGGQYRYTVAWAGDKASTAASATVDVNLSSTTSRLTGSMDQYPFAGETYSVTGRILFEVGSCQGPTTVHVTRKVGSRKAEQRQDVTTDAACNFRFEDTQPIATPVTYTVTWDGDSSHRGSSVIIEGYVWYQPVSVTATVEDQYLTPGQEAVINGSIVGERTGPLGEPLSLSVTRYGPDGSAVRLRDVKTAKDGTFSFRDTPPPLDPATNPRYLYVIEWAGNPTYASSGVIVAVYITATGSPSP